MSKTGLSSCMCFRISVRISRLQLTEMASPPLRIRDNPATRASRGGCHRGGGASWGRGPRNHCLSVPESGDVLKPGDGRTELTEIVRDHDVASTDLGVSHTGHPLRCLR